MVPKEQVEKIIADLQVLAEALGGVADMKKMTEAAKADYEDCQRRLSQIKAEVNEASAGLSQVQRQNQKQFEQEVYNRQRELKDLTD